MDLIFGIKLASLWIMIDVVHKLVLIDITGVRLILFIFEIPYGYWGMESGCKSQELDEKSHIKLLFNHILYYAERVQLHCGVRRGQGCNATTK